MGKDSCQVRASNEWCFITHLRTGFSLGVFRDAHCFIRKSRGLNINTIKQTFLWAWEETAQGHPAFRAHDRCHLPTVFGVGREDAAGWDRDGTGARREFTSLMEYGALIKGFHAPRAPSLGQLCFLLVFPTRTGPPGGPCGFRKGWALRVQL